MDSTLPRLYLISPGRHGQDFDLVAAARSAFEGGARILQVNEPQLKDQPLAELITELLEVARPFDAQLVVSAGKGAGLRVARRFKLAVHLGTAWPVAGVRKELKGLVVGASALDADAVAAAADAGADYVIVGPVLAPPDRPDAAVLGLEALRSIAQSVSIPVYASGGITPETVTRALAAGAHGVAVMRDVFDVGAGVDAAPASTVSPGPVVPALPTPAERVRRLLEAFPGATAPICE